MWAVDGWEAATWLLGTVIFSWAAFLIAAELDHEERNALRLDVWRTLRALGIAPWIARWRQRRHAAWKHRRIHCTVTQIDPVLTILDSWCAAISSKLDREIVADGHASQVMDHSDLMGNEDFWRDIFVARNFPTLARYMDWSVNRKGA